MNDFNPGDLITVKNKYKEIYLIDESFDAARMVTPDDAILVIGETLKSEVMRYELLLYFDGIIYYGIKDWFEIINREYIIL